MINYIYLSGWTSLSLADYCKEIRPDILFTDERLWLPGLFLSPIVTTFQWVSLQFPQSFYSCKIRNTFLTFLVRTCLPIELSVATLYYYISLQLSTVEGLTHFTVEISATELIEKYKAGSRFKAINPHPKNIGQVLPRNGRH